MGDLSRRKFIVMGTLAAGFAVCTHPISAQVITTDSVGLVAGSVQIPVANGAIPAYRAMPDRGSNFPVILVIQEIFGVHEHLQDICRRLAKVGYMAIAPEMFVRQGDVSKLETVEEIISQVVSKVPDAQVMSDLDATIAWARNSGKAKMNQVGITGFCWGGRITWLYAVHSPNIQAGVAWYGRLVGDYSPMTPQHPINVAANLTVPVLGLYGGNDELIPMDTVQNMRRILFQGSSQSDIFVYPGAPHGFLADYRPTYRQKEAREAWGRMIGWFKRNGVG
jgi:carboxymethylenebutenolidase